MQRVEGLGWGLEVEAFSGCIVVVGEDGVETLGWQCGDLGFSGEWPSKASDGVFDAALLPWGAGVAEVGFDAELAGQAMVPVELATVVEGYRLPQVRREGFEEAGKAVGDVIGPEACLRHGDGEPRAAFVRDEDGRARG